MTKKIKVTVSTGWANGDHVDYWELPLQWDDYDEAGKQKILDDFADEYLHDCCESFAELVDGEDEDD